jgi:alanyl-tRNA synthetase
VKTEPARDIFPPVMTRRLYYDDAYLRAFDAHVAEVSADGRRVYLDRTAFYPTSGGQPHDTGELAGVRVVDVVDEGDRIAHVLAEPVALAPGARVEGRIDWERRFDHMQQHTGQHLLSAVFAELYGFETVSVHFGAESSTIDLATATLAAGQIEAAEARANALVWEDRAVAVSYEHAAEAAGLRKRPDREGPLRIVSIDGVDRSACGGTHVRGTAEIGPVLIRGVERVRGNARVAFVCGGRALRRAREDHALLTRLALDFSARPEEVPALVTGLRERERALRAALRRAEEELAGFRARALYERTEPAEDGVRRAVERHPAGGLDELRALANAFIALPKAVLVAAVDEPPALLLAASEDSGINAGAALRAALAEVGGRGGGSPRVAQGSVPDRASLEQVIRKLVG